MSKKTSARYNEEFREAAVRLARTSGKSLTQVARELEIAPGTLGIWLREDDERQSPGAETIGQLREELRAVKKSRAVLAEENAILKKASAYFARQMK